MNILLSAKLDTDDEMPVKKKSSRNRHNIIESGECFYCFYPVMIVVVSSRHYLLKPSCGKYSSSEIFLEHYCISVRSLEAA